MNSVDLDKVASREAGKAVIGGVMIGNDIVRFVPGTRSATNAESILVGNAYVGEVIAYGTKYVINEEIGGIEVHKNPVLRHEVRLSLPARGKMSGSGKTKNAAIEKAIANARNEIKYFLESLSELERTLSV